MNGLDVIIQSLLIIVDECNQQRVIEQEIKHASIYFQQYVKGQEDVKEILDKIIQMKDTGQINEESFKKVLVRLFRLHKDNLNFSQELIRIIDL